MSCNPYCLSATRLASLNLEAWSVQSHVFQVLSENFFVCILQTLIFHSYSTYQRSLARSHFSSNMGGIIMIDTEAGRLNITNWLWIYVTGIRFSDLKPSSTSDQVGTSINITWCICHVITHPSATPRICYGCRSWFSHRKTERKAETFILLLIKVQVDLGTFKSMPNHHSPKTGA
jgi:hypothetical protein